MSCVLLAPCNVDALVTVYWYLERELDGCPDPIETAIDLLTPVGAVLFRTNVDSVNTRYRQHAECPAYRFDPVPLARLSRMVLQRALGVLDSYEYQACEIDDWESSEARAWCTALRARLEARVPWTPSQFTDPAWQPRPTKLGYDFEDTDRRDVFTRLEALEPDPHTAHLPDGQPISLERAVQSLRTFGPRLSDDERQAMLDFVNGPDGGGTT